MLKTDLIKRMNEQHIGLSIQIRNANNIAGSSNEAYSFIITSLKLLYPNITDNQLHHCITDGYNDGSFDAIFFSNREKTISIFDIKKTTGFEYGQIRNFRADIRRYLFSAHSLNGLVDIVKPKVKKARRHIARGWKVKIYIIRAALTNPHVNVIGLLERLKNSIEAIVSNNFLNIDFLIKTSLHLDSVRNSYTWGIKATSGSHDPDSLSDKIIIKDRASGPIKSIFVRLKLRDIVNIQGIFMSRGLDLFDANVRQFQKKRNISEKILYSVNSDPDTFHIFHNGLTFSCSAIRRPSENAFSIVNPQIINGCQTVSTLYDSYKNRLNNRKLKRATILCRFYALKKNMIEKVCEATNTQVKIYLWDLRSNDSIQKILEMALRVCGMDYRRKTAKRKGGEIYITDLAQWLYSCLIKKPADAKNKKSQLFDVILNNPPYKRIFNDGISLEKIVEICNVAIFVRKKIKKIPKSRRTFEQDADLHIIACIYHLRTQKWTMDRKYRRAYNIIKSAMKNIMSQYGRNLSYNRIFKMNETWQEIESGL